MMNTTKTASSIAFDDDEDSTASQEDDLEDWIDHTKRSAKEADAKMLTCNITNWYETQKKLKWRQAVRIATQSPDRWTRNSAEWNPGLTISTKTQGEHGEDDLNEFVKDEEMI